MSASRLGSPGRPTMRDVAREAGVALRTVSRVVNGEQNVNAVLAARVHAVIEELGYRPDERARMLRKGSSGTLGVAVRGAGDWLRSAEEAALGRGLLLLSCSTFDDERVYARVIESLCDRRFDGLLVEPIGESTPYLVAEVAAGLPVVAVDRPLNDVDADSVVSDSVGGIRALVAHLASLGHRRIAYVGDSERIVTGRDRAAAFRAALADLGASGVEDLVRTGEVGPELVRRALASFADLPDPPTALVAGNNITTNELLHQLGNGLGGYAFAGFDDVDGAEHFALPVTVAAQDLAGIGRTAIDLLLARLATPERARRHVVLPTELRVRASSTERALAPAAQRRRR